MKIRLILLLTALCLLMGFTLASCDPSSMMDGILGEGGLDGLHGNESGGEEDTDVEDSCPDDGSGEGENSSDGGNKDVTDDAPDLSLTSYSGIAISLDWYSEDADEYTISDEADFNGLGYLSSIEEMTFEEKKFKIAADLDLTDTSYIRIGASPTAPFSGEFCAEGHKIKFEAREDTLSSIAGAQTTDCVGTSLFVYSEGTITGIELNECVIKLPLIGNENSSYNLSYLVEYNYGTVANCAITDSYLLAILCGSKSYLKIGAVNIENHGTVEECTIDGDIEIQFASPESTAYAASVTSTDFGLIKNCSALTNIIYKTLDGASNSNVILGGIAGEIRIYEQADAAKISGCSFDGSINAASTDSIITVGGIAGKALSSGLSDCQASFTADISNDSNVIIGSVCGEASYDTSLSGLVMASIMNSTGKIELTYNEKAYDLSNTVGASNMVYLQNDNLDSQFENNYYYNTLSDNEKSFYKEAYAWLVEAGNFPFYYDYDKKITLGPVNFTDYGLTDADISELALILKLDNPEFFYIDLSYSVYTYGEDKFAEFIVDNRYIDGYDMQYEKAELDKILEEVSAATENMTDYGKIRYVYDYIIEAVEYDDTYVFEANYSIAGSLLYGSSVCTGYSYAFKYLCDYLGFETLVIVSDTMLHAWNAVMLDDTWYYVDVTWADTAERDFFLQGSDEFITEDGAANTHYAINDYLVLPEFSKESYN